MAFFDSLKDATRVSPRGILFSPVFLAHLDEQSV
jgi:hypothetical protein